MSADASPYSLRGKKVWVAGHRGMVGSALLRRLAREDCEVLTVEREAVDLTRQGEVEQWMGKTRPQAIFISAAKVGGILANDTHPVPFLYDNLAIAANVIHTAAANRVEKLLYLGSSCIYPKFRAPAHRRERAVDRSARTHQPVVRDRQDCRAQALPGLSAAIRLRLHLGHADQSVWARR